MDQWQHERAYAEWEERRAIERENAAADELIERLQRQRNSELIFKTTERCGCEPQAATMDDAEQRAWHDWLQGQFEDFARMLGSEVGTTQRQLGDALRAEFEERFNDLQLQIDELKALIEGDSNNKSRIIDLPAMKLKGRVNAA
jgi:hypothetical protein